MAEILQAGLKERLWHSMRNDLAQFLPEISNRNVLMCPACGRLLRFCDFSLEHLIPQRVVRHDPTNVRKNPLTPTNVRAGTLLLCQKPLSIKGKRVYGSGCNSWKGRFYDGSIQDLLSRSFHMKRSTVRHMVAALSVAYLALVGRYGYRIVLIASGALMRQQYFRPNHLHRDLPIRSQMVLAGSFSSPPAPDAALWTSPFSFRFEEDRCSVTARTFGVNVPISKHPLLPIVQLLPFVPPEYRLRPDFRTVFN